MQRLQPVRADMEGWAASHAQAVQKNDRLADSLLENTDLPEEKTGEKIPAAMLKQRKQAVAALDSAQKDLDARLDQAKVQGDPKKKETDPAITGAVEQGKKEFERARKDLASADGTTIRRRIARAYDVAGRARRRLP